MVIRPSWIFLLLISSLVQILVVTLYPFDFSFLSFSAWLGDLEKFQRATHIKDYVRNILLFIPWGIAIAGIKSKQHKSGWYVLGWSGLGSVVLSGSIELTQLLLPTRVSSWADILCNSLGGIIGASLYVQRQNWRQLIVLVGQNKLSQINLKFLATIIITYSVAIACGFMVLFQNINFGNWNREAYLAIASEVTGQLDWRGYIKSIYICDRQLKRTEIVSAFEQTEVFFAQEPNLVTSLTLLPLQNVYQSTTEYVPDLSWKKEFLPHSRILSPPEELNSSRNDQQVDTQTPMIFSNYNSLISNQSATKLTQTLQASQAFSLSIILATDLAEQFGPARIFSLGNNIYSRNLMLAQHSHWLFFRLRTPTTGTNATQPGFYLPNFFSDSQLHHLIITFGDRQLDFYVDRPQQHYHFSFEPATQLKLYLPWKFKSWEINLQNYNLLRARIIFYTLVLLPLAILGSILILAWISRLIHYS